MASKTVSPIISTILLILITIVSSTAAYFWMMDIQEQIQSDTEGTVSSNAANDLLDFTIMSVSCNSTSNEINLTIMNNGVGSIQSGTAILILTNINGAELYTNINSSFQGLNQGAAATLQVASSYDLIASTTYVARLTLSNSKTRSRSCVAQ